MVIPLSVLYHMMMSCHVLCHVMMYTPVFMMLEAASAHVPDIPATEAGLSSARHHRGTSRGRQPRPMEARDPATAASADQWRGC